MRTTKHMNVDEKRRCCWCCCRCFGFVFIFTVTWNAALPHKLSVINVLISAQFSMPFFCNWHSAMNIGEAMQQPTSCTFIFGFKVTWWYYCYSVCSHLLSFIYQKKTFHLNMSVLLLLLLSFVVSIWIAHVCVCVCVVQRVSMMLHTYKNAYMFEYVWLKIDFSFMAWILG